VELRDYWHVVQRRWRVIVATLLVCLGAAAVFTMTATPQYSSSARLFVSTSERDTSSAYQGGLFATQRVTSYADLVQSRELAESVADRLDASDEEAGVLRGQVEATVSPETVLLSITATDPSPERAQQIAQAYAYELQTLIEQLETPPGGNKKSPIKATIVDSATVNATPVSPQPLRNYGLAAVLGLLLGLGIAVLRELLDNTVKTPDHAVAATDASVLGTIQFDPDAPKTPLVTSLDSHAPRVEAFRVLRTNMQFVDIDSGGAGRVYVVSSSLPSEGKTTTAVNLALTLAQAGQRVALVEADLRRPRVSVALGMDNAVGLTTVLVGRLSLAEALQEHDETGLAVLGSGSTPPNPAELLQSHAMSEVLYDLRQKFEIVIIDAPPLLPVTDAALLGSQSDGVLLVVRHGKTTLDQLGAAAERLAAVGARTVGVVINMVPNRRLQGYGYGYGYGYAPDQVIETKQVRGRRGGGRRRRTSAD
jgi:receptor protein-tyrosine kinase